MPVMVEVGGVELYKFGRTTADLALLNTAQIAAMTVWEIIQVQNTAVKIDPSPEIVHHLEERSTANFTVWDEKNIYNFDYGQDVIIFDGSGRLFGGIVDDLIKAPVTRDGQHGYEYQLTAVDYQALADRRQFYRGYESAASHTIVRDILAVLAEEGITEGLIQAGPTLAMISFNGVSCAEALNLVAERAGCTWFIDEFKRLYFIARTTYPAAWNIVTGEEILWDPTPRLTIGNPEYRNVQYFQAGAAETSPLTQVFKGDGSNQTFTVGFPIAREPTILKNGVAQTVGIKGVDVSGYDWYWNEGENNVTQDSFGTKLISTDTLTIVYIGRFNLITKVTQSAEVTRQKAVQGFGSGKIEKTYKDTTIKNQTSALEAAKAKLAAYAVVGRKLAYQTLRPGLAVGTLQNVALPVLNLAAVDMLLYELRISFPQGVTTYDALVCEGPVDDSWQNLYCRLVSEIKAQNASAAGSADVVQGLEKFTKTWLSSAHPNPFLKVYDTATAANVDFPCLADEDRLSYLVLYDAAGLEFFRKPVTLQTASLDLKTIYSTCILLAAEANGTPITYVALWGGDGCSDTAGSGIEMSKHEYSKTKNVLESLQFDFEDIQGW